MGQITASTKIGNFAFMIGFVLCLSNTLLFYQYGIRTVSLPSTMATTAATAPTLVAITATTNKTEQQQQQCKTLWFAAMAIDQFTECARNHQNQTTAAAAAAAAATTTTTATKFANNYEETYAASIVSLVETQSNKALKPILILHDPAANVIKDVTNSNSNPLIGRFAASRGATVITINTLSFQTDINNHPQFGQLPFTHRVGPFIRLDLFNIISKTNLFHLPGVCQDYVLYTDSDVIFANQITQRTDLEPQKSKMKEKGKIVAYGPERSKRRWPIANTGVMFIDIPRFENELLPSLLKYLRSDPNRTYRSYDQGLICSYFGKEKNNAKGDLLDAVGAISPMWNWKLYWTFSTTKKRNESMSDIKVIHFHGPKPGRCLDEYAQNKDCHNEHLHLAYQKFQHEIYKNRNGTVKYAMDMTAKSNQATRSFLNTICSH